MDTLVISRRPWSAPTTSTPACSQESSPRSSQSWNQNSSLNNPWQPSGLTRRSWSCPGGALSSSPSRPSSPQRASCTSPLSLDSIAPWMSFRVGHKSENPSRKLCHNISCLKHESLFGPFISYVILFWPLSLLITQCQCKPLPSDVILEQLISTYGLDPSELLLPQQQII